MKRAFQDTSDEAQSQTSAMLNRLLSSLGGNSNSMISDITGQKDSLLKDTNTNDYMLALMMQQQKNREPKYNDDTFIKKIDSQLTPQITPSSVGDSKTIADAIQKIDDQKLKYSMKRGKGCTDCSAFTQNVFKDVYGKDIGGYTGTQQNAGTTVTDGNYKDGDLIFTSPDNGKRTGGISHVGIYRDINGVPSVTDFSSANGGGVRTTPLASYYKPWKVQRVI